jgi:hypothetical protein
MKRALLFAFAAMLTGCQMDWLTGVKPQGAPMCQFPARTHTDTISTFVYHGDTVVVGPPQGGQWWYTISTTLPAGMYPCDSGAEKSK